MASITLQVLDGADRGIVFDELPTPITIGREEGNAIQLNDDRISRFHVKIQEDRGKIVLTDLESTNGTRVNGRETQLRILKFGDLIAVGRSTLLYGSRDQIAEHVDKHDGNGVGVGGSSVVDKITGPMKDSSDSLSIQLNLGESHNFPSALFLAGPPELPDALSPAQAAQVSEMIEYFHTRCRSLMDGVEVGEGDEPVRIDQERWQELLDMQALLAQYLRKIGGNEAE